MKKAISFSIDSEIKESIDVFARSRGMKNAGALSRQATFEYIRRKLPKDVVTVQLLRLQDIINGVIE